MSRSVSDTAAPTSADGEASRVNQRRRPSESALRRNRWFVRAYRAGLGVFIGSQILLLATKGRRTGKTHRVPLGFVPASALKAHLPATPDSDEAQPPLDTSAIFIFAGQGNRTDWFRNLLASRSGTVQQGFRTWPATAQRVRDERLAEAVLRAYLDRYGTGIAERLGITPGDDASFAAAAQRIPVVQLTPRRT